MKKLLIVSAIAAVAFGACKKKEGSVSTVHSYATPTIIMITGDYYSMPVGGMVPEMKATAYDSFYHEVCTVVYDQSKLDVTTPGVYPVIATAKNQYGMATSRTLHVAVTNESATVNLAGTYVRSATDDTIMVTLLANGLYSTNDVAANGAFDTTTAVASAYFIQTTDVAIEVPSQATVLGTIYSTGGTVTMTPTDTTFEYVLHNVSLSPVTRVFKKIH